MLGGCTLDSHDQTKVCHRLPPRKLPEILFRRDDENLNIFTGFIDKAVKTGHQPVKVCREPSEKKYRN